MALIRNVRFERNPPAVSRHAALWRPDFPLDWFANASFLPVVARPRRNRLLHLFTDARNLREMRVERVGAMHASPGSIAPSLSSVKTVFVHSLGCRASQADGAAYSRHRSRRAAICAVRDASLRRSGCSEYLHRDTASADVDARRMPFAGCIAIIRTPRFWSPAATPSALRRNWRLSMACAGWWAIPIRPQIADMVSDPPGRRLHGQILIGDISTRKTIFLPSPVNDVRRRRTRPNLKVQDGCSNRCSFCIIPSVRGRSRSAPLENIVEQMRDLATRYREVVLSGINLGRWGGDLAGRPAIRDLLRAILQERRSSRLRISSVEPMDWSAELLEFMAERAAHRARMFTSAAVGLRYRSKRMFRKYRTRHYAIAPRNRAPPYAGCGIGADVMTGFPARPMRNSKKPSASSKSARLPICTCLRTRNGPARTRRDQPIKCSVSLRRERTGILRDLSDRKNADFRGRMVGRTLSAVTLSNDSALTGNFLRVQLATPRVPNDIIDIEIGAAGPGQLKEREILPVLSN